MLLNILNNQLESAYKLKISQKVVIPAKAGIQ